MKLLTISTPVTYALLADLILLVHTLFIVFVVGGFVLIMIGIIFKKSWIENFWFRAIHLFAIIVVAVKPLTDRFCPLTVWESRLRAAAGEQAYSGGFIQYWVHRLIYYDLPLSFFAVLYTLFALIVLCTWIFSPPRRPRFLWLKSSQKDKGTGKKN